MDKKAIIERISLMEDRYDEISRVLAALDDDTKKNVNLSVYSGLLMDFMEHPDDVTIYDGHSQICFNFDFWTKELCLESYETYTQRDVIIKAFRRIYNSRFEQVSIAVDEPWDDDIKPYRDMMGNDEYDQETVTREYEELLAHKAQ